ncbi:histidine kinase [Paenibacillus flagellatus]|uniref:histidine kinase n=2 Tax=Paenibacillus flagellatus TaxID=2211139 RepID=A0A2V5KD48_9BACL|nr:histidine kinase [Paenibacillus flagellatus]
MTKRRAFLTVLFFFAALIVVRLVWVDLLAPPNHPHAVRGVLDLRGWDVKSGPAITLNGEWEFYPNALIGQTEGAPAPSGDGSTLIRVPGKWNRSMNPEPSAYGYGSYRLRVQVDADPETTYGIRMPIVRSASELYVNGRLVANQGEPAADKERYTARNVPYSAYFTADSGVIEIVVQVANYDNGKRGGITETVKFGNAEAVNRDVWVSVILQLIVVVVLSMHAVYAIVLYALGARQTALFVFFSLVVCAMVMTLTDDDKLLMVWLPFIDYGWSIKLQLLSVVGVGANLLLFARHLMPEYARLRWFRWLLIGCAAEAASVVLLPIRITLQALIVYFGSLIVITLVFLALTLRIAVTKDKDALFLSLGLTAVFASVLGGMYKATLEAGYYPVDLVVAFVAFATFWFRRYFRASSEAHKLAEELQRADKLKDDFLANTSHELRNPLHGMINIAQSVLDSGIPDPNRHKESMELLISVGKRMSFLLNDLLDLKVLQDERIRLHTGAVRVQSVATGVIDMLRFMTAGKPIRIVQSIPDGFPAVVADENRLAQILFNLLHNAVKFTNEGTVAIRAELEDGRAVVVVEDTGIGMDAETARTAFVRYGQGDTGAAGAGGLGLGLSICQQLVELHGGELTADSVPGKGSAFRFPLPLAAEEDRLRDGTPPVWPPSAETAAAAVAAPAERKGGPDAPDATEPSEAPDMPDADRPRVLVVDDDPVNLHIIRRLLPPNRYRVTTAGGAQEALAMLDGREWDLVVSDVMMPHMSGYELTRAVRERYGMSELPVLLLTARNRPEDIDAGFRSGANDYVTKPVDAKELRARAKALTDLKRSVRERLRMEAAWLQAQIQPHFLFNTLNSIAALSHIDPDKMRALLEVFGRYLRASFDFRNVDRLVPFQHELNLVRSYVYIEKERFGNRLQVVWEADEDLFLQVPPLSIQPLVENAIRHGILRRNRGGTVHIRVTPNDGYAEISVRDDGVGIGEEKLATLLDKRTGGGRLGVGLPNIDRRLKQLYGRGLHIRSVPDQGTVVKFTVTT